MRPRNLRLAGFTCYSDPVAIDFAGMDLFVVSGPTGAGKSTIVDAICYALYGRVPRFDGTSGLIAHNRDEMYVHLEFSVAGDLYRVMRTLNRRRKTAKDGSEKTTRLPSTVVLEHREGGEWEPIAGRVREIDDRIEEILGLDFNGFTRCIVLPQGQFQEFLAGDREKRRDLLVELLDISAYGRIMTAANTRASELAKEASAIDRRLAEDYADATPEALEAKRRQREADRPTLETATRLRDALNGAVELAGTVANERERQRKLVEGADAARKELAGAQRLAKDGEAQIKGLRAELAAAEEALKAIAYDRDLHQRLGVALTHADAIERLTQQLGEATAVARDETKLAAAKTSLAAAERERTDAEAAVAAARERLYAAQRADAAAHVRGGLRPGDTCPVCGGVVGKLPRAPAGDGLGAANKALAAAEQRGRRAADARIKAAQAVEREQQRLKDAAGEAKRVQKELGAQGETLRGLLPPTIAAERPAIAVALEAQKVAAREADTVTERINTLRRQIAELEPRVAASGQKIAALTATSAGLEAQGVEAGRAADAGKEQLIALATEWSWSDILAMIEAKRDPRATLVSMRNASQQQADDITKRLAGIEAEEKRIEQAIVRAMELRAELQEKRERSALYGELGRLLRADNFQAFVIEEAMQALADSASRHLATLYDQFAITVDGGEFQVIDHWQADQVRPARTLSGGETFVASLALALALSERLPELRSKTAAVLESLFLDEGFGALDPEVLEVVISALEGLRSEERMVGIITHVPELARRIESRIEVSKSPAGSTASVA
ncbi:MAG: SMC family ATPase [Chloroflexota bacterium]|nr:SMC family ATPase [Chloroflexota bacterium]